MLFHIITELLSFPPIKKGGHTLSMATLILIPIYYSSQIINVPLYRSFANSFKLS